MKKILLILVFVGMAQTASATQLRWDDVYANCDDDMAVAECLSLFLLPSLPLNSFGVLVWEPIFSIDDRLKNHISQIEWDATLDIPENTSIDDASALTSQFLREGEVSFTDVLLGWLVGVISGIAVFLLIIATRFIQFYIMISVGWYGWSRVFMHNDSELPIPKSVATILIMFAGSVYLLAKDWGGVFSGVIS